MDSLMVSMSTRTCSSSNRFVNSSWNSVIFNPICMVSTLGGLLVIHIFLSNLMLLISILWSIPVLTWLITATSVTMSGLFVRMQ